MTAKLGESWLVFFRRQFGKIGLFPWTDANGNFVLSRPNGEQAPMVSFRRNGYNNKRRDGNVIRYQLTHDTTARFSEIVIFARNEGRKKGHNHTHGRFTDEEMKALGFNRRHVYRDMEVNNAEEAEFYARRKMAEVNRASWKLVYTVSGHSAPISNGEGQRAVIVPDTIARVDDEDLGIHENLYIESVEYRSPPRETIVTMMRPQDLLFGDFQAKAAAKKAAARAKARPIVNISSSSIISVDQGRTVVTTFDTKISSKTPEGRTATTTIHRGGQ